MTTPRTTPKPDDLLSVAELARAVDRSEPTIWTFLKRHDLPRFKVPARGKTTLVRWGDFHAAWTAPQPAGGTTGTGKAAA